MATHSSILARRILWTEEPGGLAGSVVNNLPAMQETWVRSLGLEDPSGQGNGTPL